MIELPNIKTETDLFYFLTHVIHSRFPKHAVLKGGMVLRLLGSKRQTLDLDYTFVPFASKKEILEDIKKLFSEISEIEYSIKTNSKAIRVNLIANNFRAQVEINVAKELKTDVVSTALFKDVTNPIQPRIIKIMSLDVALSHKLAAWNERRLFRDLYDVFYFLEVQGVTPDWDILDKRLSSIQSRRPEMKRIKSMTMDSFKKELKTVVDEFTQKDLEDELGGILNEIELTGLAFKMKDTFNRFLQNNS